MILKVLNKNESEVVFLTRLWDNRRLLQRTSKLFWLICCGISILDSMFHLGNLEENGSWCEVLWKGHELFSWKVILVRMLNQYKLQALIKRYYIFQTYSVSPQIQRRKVTKFLLIMYCMYRFCFATCFRETNNVVENLSLRTAKLMKYDELYPKRTLCSIQTGWSSAPDICYLSIKSWNCINRMLWFRLE